MTGKTNLHKLNVGLKKVTSGSLRVTISHMQMLNCVRKTTVKFTYMN